MGVNSSSHQFIKSIKKAWQSCKWQDATYDKIKDCQSGWQCATTKLTIVPRLGHQIIYWLLQMVPRQRQLRYQVMTIWYPWHWESVTSVDTIMRRVLHLPVMRQFSHYLGKIYDVQVNKKGKVMCDQNAGLKQCIHCDWNTETLRVLGTGSAMSAHLLNQLMDDPKWAGKRKRTRWIDPAD